MRIILYTGKGGVGKTSVSSMTAIKLADEGKKVMVISTDQAHSLSDSLEVQLGPKTIHICENLDAMEIDVVEEAENAWGNLKDYMKSILTLKAANGIESEELMVFPGLEELFALFKILDIYEEDNYDVLIVDCAPTGETLSLLKFPEMFGMMFDKILPVKRKMVKRAGPLIEKTMKLPMPEDSVFDDIERLMDKLERLQLLMLNKDVTSLRIVSTPEKIVIKETKRNYTWLQLYDYNVDAVIVNKVYPEEALVGYFNKWVKLQKEGLDELEVAFTDLPLFTIMLQKHELKSLDVLRSVNTFYNEVDPSEVLIKRQIFKVFAKDGKQRMEIYLPFSEKHEMELEQHKGEVHISIKNEKRCFLLPDILLNKEIVAAKLDEGILAIDFE